MTMTEVLQYIFEFVKIPIIITVFACLVGCVIPRCFLKTRYSYKEGLGRGLKKYTFPEGRGVLYEPHPSIRKYIPKYLLFTAEGYKYLKISFDAGVELISYTAVMLNNKDRVLGVLDIDEVPKNREGSCVLLHPDTSYVSLFLRSVDGKNTDSAVAYRRPIDYALYFLAVSVCCFITAFALGEIVNGIVYRLTEAVLPILDYPMVTVTFSLIGGGVGTVLSYLHSEKKGVRVILK